MHHPAKFTQAFAKGLCVVNEFLFQGILNGHRYKEVVYSRKITYSDDKKLYMNLCYKEPINEEKRPVFIYVHGGGWVSSKPEYREGFVSRVAELGFFTASIFYGLAPKVKHPSSIENIYKALNYIVENKDKYNLDLDNIYLGGESAGAHLVSVMGAISTNAEYKNKFNLSEKSKNLLFKGLYLNCGIYNMDDCLNSGFPNMKSFVAMYYGKKLSEIKTDKAAEIIFPYHYINSNYPKSFIITAQLDALKKGGENFYNYLKKSGVPCKYFYGTGLLAVHAFAASMLLKKSRYALKTGMEFLTNNK